MPENSAATNASTELFRSKGYQQLAAAMAGGALGGQLIQGVTVARAASLALCLVGIAVFSLIGGKHFLDRIQVCLPQAFLVVWMIVLLIASRSLFRDLSVTVEMVLLIVTGWVAGSVLGTEGVRKAFLVACYVLCAASLIAVVVTADARSEVLGPVGWRGIFGHKTGSGFCSAIGVVLAASGPGRRSDIVMGVPCLILLLGSGSSTALGGTLVAVTFSRAVLLGGSATRSRAALATAVASVTGMLLLTTSADEPASRPIDSLANSIGKDVTLTGRSEIWSGVLDQLTGNWLTGLGLGYPWTKGAPTEEVWRRLGVQVAHAHNAPLEWILRAGVPGSILACLTLVWILLRRVFGAHRGNMWLSAIPIFLAMGIWTEIAPLFTVGMLLLATNSACDGNSGWQSA